MSQITIILFALFSGREEAHFTYPFRMLSGFDPVVRKEQSDNAHKFGAFGVASVCLGIAAILTIEKYHVFSWGAVMYFSLLSVIYLFEYWLIFDCVYAKCIGQGWFYLGSTAKTDKVLRRFYIKNVGVWKACICILFIFLLNYLIQ